MHRSTAYARFRLELGRQRPFDASLEMRIQCWLTRIARAIRERDTPQDRPQRRPD
jgi:hypothetical protein